MVLGDDGQIQAKQKTCLFHPQPVSFGQVIAATDAYKMVVKHVASAIFTQCLKAEGRRLPALIEKAEMFSIGGGEGPAAPTGPT